MVKEGRVKMWKRRMRRGVFETGGRVRRERAEYFILGDTGCTAAASIATEYIKRRGIVTDNNNRITEGRL